MTHRNLSTRILAKGLLCGRVAFLALLGTLVLAGSAHADEPATEAPRAVAPSAEPPAEVVQAPAPSAEPPAEAVQAPVPPVEPPVEQVVPPVEPPVERVVPPVEPPVERVVPPVEQPAEQIASPAEAPAEQVAVAPPVEPPAEPVAPPVKPAGEDPQALAPAVEPATEKPQTLTPTGEAATKQVAESSPSSPPAAQQGVAPPDGLSGPAAAEVPSALIASLATGPISNDPQDPSAASIARTASIGALVRGAAQHAGYLSCEIGAAETEAGSCRVGWLGGQSSASASPVEFIAKAAAARAAAPPGGGSGGSAGGGSRPVLPPPGPAPSGAVSGSAAGGSGIAFSDFFTLAGLLLLAAPRAMRRLRLSCRPWLTTFFVLIPERPG